MLLVRFDKDGEGQTAFESKSCPISISGRFILPSARSCRADSLSGSYEGSNGVRHTAKRIMKRHDRYAWQTHVLCVVCLLPPSSTVAEDSQAVTPKIGTIEGVITYSGDVPKSKVRDDAGQQRKLLSVHRRSRGVRYALVYLEANAANRPGDSEVQRKELARKPIVVDQVEHAFKPHLIAIRDGQKVKFTNSDAANHNVHTIGFEPKNQFNVLVGTTGEYIHQFVAERKSRPISLKCDLHPWMQGWIYVLNHPYFAVSDEHGTFRIGSVPHGKYQVEIRQPDVGYRKTISVDVEPKKSTKVNVEIAPEDLKIR